MSTTATRARRFGLILSLGLASTLGLGCFGPSNDKGDNPNPGTGRPASGTNDDAKTGGMGGVRDPNNPTGPGEAGPKSSSAPDAGPK